MPVPKRKTSHSKRNKRRAHDAIASIPATMDCPECSETMTRHRACPHCGSYRGRQVIEVVD